MEEKFSERITSRKFISLICTVVAIIAIPILYKYVQIADSITLVVIGAIGTASSAYIGFNVLEKIKK